MGPKTAHFEINRPLNYIYRFQLPLLLSTRRDYLKNKRVVKSENFQFKTIIIGFKLILILIYKRSHYLLCLNVCYIFHFTLGYK